MRKFTFIFYIISLIILGILGAWIGAYVYKINNIGDVELPILEGMENKDLEYELAMIVNDSEGIVSPNATLVIKSKYNKCGHEIKQYEEIEEQYVNLNKEEFEQEFLKDNENFIIENFTPKEIVVLQEFDSNCNEHYLLKSKNGVVVIYKYDQKGNKTEYKETSIGIEYLTDEDRQELENGIEIVGDSELNSRLEDYV